LVIQERESRFVVAHASGRRGEETLAAEAIAKAHARSRGQPVSWFSDGWQAYPKAIRRAYRQPVRTGQRGRPPLRVPEGVSLTQTIKHRDEHGRLLSVETRATMGAAAEQSVAVHIERLNGVLRDRLACLTRKTHAFAKSTATWDALFGLALFEHNWLRAHLALRRPSSTVPGRYYERRTPAMAVGLTEHRWSWQEFLTTKATSALEGVTTQTPLATTYCGAG
jgi:IS1 family transposase